MRQWCARKIWRDGSPVDVHFLTFRDTVGSGNGSLMNRLFDPAGKTWSAPALTADWYRKVKTSSDFFKGTFSVWISGRVINVARQAAICGINQRSFSIFCWSANKLVDFSWDVSLFPHPCDKALRFACLSKTDSMLYKYKNHTFSQSWSVKYDTFSSRI